MTASHPRAQERRDRAAAARQAAARAAHRRRNRRRLAVLAAALVALVTVGIVIQSQRGGVNENAAVPPGLVDGVGVPVGAATAPVAVQVYEDFQCPACQRFELTAGDTITQLVEAKTIRVTYFTMAFLDSASTTKYSTRAANAGGCAVQAGTFPAFHRALYEAQPAEGTAGLSDQRLIEIGKATGATGSKGDRFATCVQDQQFLDWTATVTDYASRKGVNSTPTVFVDGKKLTDLTAEGLQQAVTAAAKS